MTMRQRTPHRTGATAIVKPTGQTPNDISVTATFGKTEGSSD
jgi:hypothetical protein